VVHPLFGEPALPLAATGAAAAHQAAAAVAAMVVDCLRSCSAAAGSRRHAVAPHLLAELQLHADLAVVHLHHAGQLAVHQHLAHQPVARQLLAANLLHHVVAVAQLRKAAVVYLANCSVAARASHHAAEPHRAEPQLHADLAVALQLHADQLAVHLHHAVARKENQRLEAHSSRVAANDRRAPDSSGASFLR